MPLTDAVKGTYVEALGKTWLMKSGWSPVWWLLLFAAAFLSVNLITASRSPTVWKDEVIYTDPAFHWARGDGLTSTSSPSRQNYGEFWAMNAPLHPLLLGCWIRCLGFDVVQVRLFNYMLAAVAIALCAGSLARAGRGAGATLLVALLLACGAGITFAYRSGRSEGVGMLLCGFMLWGLTFTRGKCRLAVCAAVGLFLPWAGTHLVAVCLIAAACVLLHGRGRYYKELIATGLGVAAGAGGLILTYTTQGVLDAWIRCMELHSVYSKQLENFPAGIVRSYLQDPSYACLITAALILRLGQRSDDGKEPDIISRSALTLALLVPPLFYLLGNYPVYYSWIAYIPLVFFVIDRLEFCRCTGAVRTTASTGAALLMGLAVFIGLPLRTIVTVVEWSRRDYAPVMKVLEEQIRPGDWILGEPQAFYVASAKAARVYYETPLNLKAEDGPKITLLIANSENAPRWQELLGGKWTKVKEYKSQKGLSLSFFGQMPTSSSYNFDFWRRSNTQSHP